jgi:hypothetical protein
MAGHYLHCRIEQIDKIFSDLVSSDLSMKIKSLLTIAASVQKGGKHVTQEQVEDARNKGATDNEIHDVVLIASAFCMFNRYVDGLATWAPVDRQVYVDRAPMRAAEGYIASIDKLTITKSENVFKIDP